MFYFSQNLDDIDETLTERLLGLTEMFPDSVRNGTSTAAKGVFSGAKWLYKFTGKTCWILSTSFVILALPIIFEVERVQTEEAQLQQQRQVSLFTQSVHADSRAPYLKQMETLSMPENLFLTSGYTCLYVCTDSRGRGKQVDLLLEK